VGKDTVVAFNYVIANLQKYTALFDLFTLFIDTYFGFAQAIAYLGHEGENADKADVEKLAIGWTTLFNETADVIKEVAGKLESLQEGEG
jgi:hypothetical protein